MLSPDQDCWIRKYHLEIPLGLVKDQKGGRLGHCFANINMLTPLITWGGSGPNDF
jgi:hypothetical protein